MTNYISGPIYKMVMNPYTKSVGYILRLTDELHIPMDPDNRDYAEYLKWIDAGNVPQLPDLPQENT
jgi:hypothetical protein